MLIHKRREFPSDMFTIMSTVGANLTIGKVQDWAQFRNKIIVWSRTSKCTHSCVKTHGNKWNLLVHFPNSKILCFRIHWRFNNVLHFRRIFDSWHAMQGKANPYGRIHHHNNYYVLQDPFNYIQLIQKRLSFKNLKLWTLSAQGMMGVVIQSLGAENIPQ